MASRLPKAQVLETRSMPSSPTRAIALSFANSTDAFMNQLRWALARDIPTVALYEVEIMQSSPFPCEYIAHRLALIPFTAKLPNASQGTIRLDAQKEGRVHAGDITGDFRAIAPEAVITTLPARCSLQLVGKLNVGFGKEHQRYNHVAAARVRRHSVGFDSDVGECWCKDTRPGARCQDCAGTKCSDTSAAIEHILEFECFGELSPDELLRQALLITRAKLDQIRRQMRVSNAGDNDAPAAVYVVHDAKS